MKRFDNFFKGFLNQGVLEVSWDTLNCLSLSWSSPKSIFGLSANLCLMCFDKKKISFIYTDYEDIKFCQTAFPSNFLETFVR